MGAEIAPGRIVGGEGSDVAVPLPLKAEQVVDAQVTLGGEAAADGGVVLDVVEVQAVADASGTGGRDLAEAAPELEDAVIVENDDQSGNLEVAVGAEAQPGLELEVA